MVVEIAVCGVYLTIGQLIRRAGLLSQSDSQVAHQILEYGTLPSVLLLVLSRSTLSAVTIAAVALASAAFVTSSTAVAWVVFAKRRPRERAALLGTCVGYEAAALPLALSQAVFGLQGLQLAALFGLFNCISARFVAYCLFGSAGPAFPPQFVHTDGGVYRGAWEGKAKSGLGVYKWPSQARYAGQWLNNNKHGSGIYSYPKGGIYKGQWAEGVIDGLGVRVYKSGRTSSGRWSAGVLATEMPLSAISAAVVDADRAAQAAHSVKVGGGSFLEALQQLTTYVPAWAAVAGCAFAAIGVALPPTVTAIAAPLASAHLQLALVVTGADFKPRLPSRQETADVAGVAAARFVPPLLLGAVAMVILPHRLLYVVAVAMLSALGPVPYSSLAYVRDFRLDEQTVSAAVTASLALSVVLSVGAAVAFSSVPFDLKGGMMAIDQTARLATISVAGAALLAAAAFAAAKIAAPKRPGVRMTYKISQQPAGATGAASFPVNSGPSGPRQPPPATSAFKCAPGCFRQDGLKSAASLASRQRQRYLIGSLRLPLPFRPSCHYSPARTRQSTAARTQQSVRLVA